MKFDPDPNSTFGLVGLVTGEIWKTTDLGKSWQKSGMLEGEITDFTFKEGGKAWATSASEWLRSEPSCSRTDNYGVSWSNLNLFENIRSIHYQATTKHLLVSDWNNSVFLSQDLGDNWRRSLSSSGNGFAELNDSILIITSAPQKENWWISSNAGLDWTKLPLNFEVWQAATISCPYPVFIAIAEDMFGSVVITSTDSLKTWASHSTTLGSTGCAKFDSRGFLYTQGVNYPDKSGFWISKDLGKTWQSIGGPSNIMDTRFDIRDNIIYAGDIDGNLWAMDLTPGYKEIYLSSDTLSFVSSVCESTSKQLEVSTRDCCGPLRIVGMRLSDSNAFTISSKSYDGIATDAVVTYSPTHDSNAESELIVSYQTLEGTKEARIILNGKTSQKTEQLLTLSVQEDKQVTFFAGDTLELNIKFKNIDPLDSFRVSMTYRPYSINILSIFYPSNLQELSWNVMSPGNVLFAGIIPNTSVAEVGIKCILPLSVDSIVDFLIKDLYVIGGLSDCAYRIEQPFALALNKTCDQAIIINVFKEALPFSISGVAYDVPSHYLRVIGTSKVNEINYELVDLLGNRLNMGTCSLSAGIHLGILPSGKYFLRFSASNFSQSFPLVIVR